jgi:hypothetical protein
MTDPLRTALLETLHGLRAAIPDQNPFKLPHPQEDETSFNHLRWMVDHCVENIEKFPPDKTSRWIGFIQGVLTCKGALNVRHERDRTRPLFHAAYEAMGIIPPESAG